MLWGPTTNASIWIGSVSFEDPFENLLRIFELTGFGAAKAEALSTPPALVTLNEVAYLYRERKLRCSMRAKEIASQIISIAPDTALMNAMSIMCEKRVRRLFLSNRKGAFISDRNILSFLFSPKALKVARDSPESWTDVDVSSIPFMEARPVPSQSTVQEVGAMPVSGQDVFVLADDDLVVSKWDLVMKPWKAEQLRLKL